MDLSELVQDVIKHAEITTPYESCGVAVISVGKLKYIPCTNISTDINMFIISPEEFADISDKYTVVGICHSHINCSPKPSPADIVSCEASKLPWLIVSYPVGSYEILEPTGYMHPLVGRPYYYGTLDCFSIIRDYYRTECDIIINDYHREPDWWHTGGDMYEENFIAEGFVEVPIGSLQLHDAILMKIDSNVSNHAAIYLGNTHILHHRTNRLSSKDVYGGYWRKNTSKVLRHRKYL